MERELTRDEVAHLGLPSRAPVPPYEAIAWFEQTLQETFLPARDVLGERERAEQGKE
jgi:hypothetical protein